MFLNVGIRYLSAAAILAIASILRGEDTSNSYGLLVPSVFIVGSPLIEPGESLD